MVLCERKGGRMKYEHKELIHDYLHIEKQIKRIENRMYNAEIEFYAQNFYGRTDFYDPIGVRNRGFRVETRVADYVDYIQMCERNIEKNKRRMHYFNRYISTLDRHTLSSLKRRYSNISRLDDIEVLGHDEQVLDEILEIEEAISHEFDFEKLPEFDKKMMLVEFNDLEPDTLEDSFETMLEVLGV